MPFQRKRTDKNHREIREALRRLGCEVVDTSQHGLPLLDLLVVCRGNAYLVEVKDRRGELSLKQADFIVRVGCAVVVRSLDDAVLLCNDYETLRRQSLREALSALSTKQSKKGAKHESK